MPLYEYKCPGCGNEFERLVDGYMSADLPEKCPHCPVYVHRLPSAPSVRFKGTGFYATDYNKKAPRDEES